jgi:hypothetical protein
LPTIDCGYDGLITPHTHTPPPPPPRGWPPHRSCYQRMMIGHRSMPPSIWHVLVRHGTNTHSQVSSLYSLHCWRCSPSCGHCGTVLHACTCHLQWHWRCRQCVQSLHAFCGAYTIVCVSLVSCTAGANGHHACTCSMPMTAIMNQLVRGMLPLNCPSMVT